MKRSRCVAPAWLASLAALLQACGGGGDGSSAGQNIAAGYGSVQAVVDGWMASEGHCVNMMSASFVHAGLACARNAASTYRIYWTLDFARPR